MLDFFLDIRYGLRMLIKSPVVVAIAVVSLAAGIAANTTTFAVANGFLFAPFPYEKQDQLVLLREIHQKSTDYQSLSPGNFLDYHERSTFFQGLVAYDVVPANVTGGDEPERVRLVTMSPETFAVLGRSPMLGRDFEPGEGVAGRRDVVALSYPFWQRYFGQDRNVLGRSINVDGRSHVIVAVMPEDFDFLPANVDLYRPTNWEDRRQDRERSLLVIGRLKPGRTVEEAQGELATIAPRLASEHPQANEGYGVLAIGLRDYFPGRTDTRLMFILLTVASFVLLIACANIANLLLARAEGRQREVAVRTALGAGRSRILRQLLTESVLLSLLGGALGTIGSIYAVRALRQTMPAELPRSFLPDLDTTVLLYTVAISMLAGIVIGIAPAFHTFGDDIRENLGETSRGGTVSRKRNRLRSVFVVAELAAALALLVGSGALINLFDQYVLKDPGCRVKGIVTAQLNVAENRHSAEADLRVFYREVIRRLQEIPEVQAVAAMNELPRSRDVSSTELAIDGRPQSRYNEEPITGWQAVNASYFSALEIPVLRGRGITEADREDSDAVAVVNESFVDSFFRDQDPIGKTVTLLKKSRRIVGISSDVYQTRMPEKEGGRIGPVVYLPMEQQPVRRMSLALRTDADVERIAPHLRAAVWSVDPQQPIAAVQTLEDHIATQLSGPRTINLVLTIFGATALFLSAIGIYGVMAHGVAQKTREIGIRMALGAGTGDVVRLVTRQGLRLTALGLLLGAPLAFALTRAVASAFSGPTGLTPTLLLAIVGGLVAVAFIATYLPARRASHVQPVRALATE